MATESRRAQHAFGDYRDLGARRSLQALRQHYLDQAETGAGPRPPTTALSTLKLWSVTWRWQARIARWEMEVQATSERAARERLQREIDEHAERMTRLENAAFTRLSEMLEWPIARRTVVEGGQTVIIQPAHWSYQTILSGLAALDRLFRLRTGLATSRDELDIDDVVKLVREHAVARGLTDEETEEAVEATLADLREIRAGKNP
jgi:hypothetical protein